VMRVLPVFRGFTVDLRLRQFRKVTKKRELIFIDFDSPEGDQLLADLIRSLDKKTDKHTLKEIANLF
ncbi:MAG: hypothetical protein ABH986_04695, partial [archaeon]